MHSYSTKLSSMRTLQVFANESKAVIAGLPSLEEEGGAFFAAETAGAAPSLESLQAEPGDFAFHTSILCYSSYRTNLCVKAMLAPCPEVAGSLAALSDGWK